MWEEAHHTFRRKFTKEQRGVYTQILDAVHAKEGGVFFLNAAGGTGKSFLLSTLLKDVRSRGHVAIACASSGIAATLYELGHTVHSVFHLPRDEASLSCVDTLFGPNSRSAELLRAARLVVIDEAVMLKGSGIHKVYPGRLRHERGV